MPVSDPGISIHGEVASGGGTGRTRGVIYCVVPPDLAQKLHEPLRDHFRADPRIRVVVEFRAAERRKGARRAEQKPPAADRRRVRSEEGRRVGERRALALPLEAPPLPPGLSRYRDRLVFVERHEPTAQKRRDADSARLVMRIQAGDQAAFSELYLSNFDAVYTYLRVALNDYHEAEDVAQQVFTRVLKALPRYEIRRGKPFRAWLFTIARNEVLDHYRKHDHIEVEEPEQMSRRRAAVSDGDSARLTLDWLSDDDLMMLIERLPSAQRQALTLRFMLGLTTDEMAAVLDRSQAAVRKLESRALRYLEDRLAALGRGPVAESRRSPMVARVRRAPVLRARRFALGTEASRAGADTWNK